MTGRPQLKCPHVECKDEMIIHHDDSQVSCSEAMQSSPFHVHFVPTDAI